MIFLNMKIWGRDIEINYLKQSENVEKLYTNTYTKAHLCLSQGHYNDKIKFVDNFPNPQNKK